MLEDVLGEDRIDAVVSEREWAQEVPGQVDLAADQIRIHPSGQVVEAAAEMEA